MVAVELSEEVVSKLETLGIRRGTYALEPLNRIQKVIAARLTEAARDIPTFPLTIDIVVDSLLAVRSHFNATGTSHVSVNDLMIKASALALQEVPAVNSSYTPLGFVRHRHADIAIAVGTDAGLMTPIIFAAEEKSIGQISAEARDLSERARSHRLKSDEYIGGTFTVSNLGMFGIANFASIINPPHSAILSIGAAKPIVVVESGQVRSIRSISVTLTCDHRAIDGIIGANWLNAFRRVIEQPDQLLK
jgi:pyruvate dehydrogenase E2 component (dihydrolipoamide acetyltransferase)